MNNTNNNNEKVDNFVLTFPKAGRKKLLDCRL